MAWKSSMKPGQGRSVGRRQQHAGRKECLTPPPTVVCMVLLSLPALFVHAAVVPGRYAHCAVSFADHMIVYGGRGFQEGRNSLSTLGCASAS